jgi:hypothetical protein
LVCAVGSRQTPSIISCMVGHSINDRIVVLRYK